MKSHVRENMRKNIIDCGYTMHPISDGVCKVEFASYVWDIIIDKAPNIRFSNWLFYPETKIWKAKAAAIGGGSEITMTGKSINDVIDASIRSLFSTTT